MRRVVAPLLAALGACSRGQQHAKASTDHQGSVGHLLLDIDQSVRTAQGDAEVVFASLFAYDHQLEQSLSREMASMNTTLSKLSAVRTSYLAKAAASQAQVQALGVAARSSEQSASLAQVATAKAGGQFDSLSSTVAALKRALRGAQVAPKGALVLAQGTGALGEPSRVYRAVRELLASHGALRPRFPDVFAAFAPAADASSSPEGPSLELVRMTPALLQRTLLALGAVESRLSSQRQRSMRGLADRATGLAAKAAATQAQEAAQQGMQAETEHAVEDLSFSMAFTEEVWKMDKNLRSTVGGNMKAKADLVDRIRQSRQKQLKALADLIELLGARRGSEADAAQTGLSLLEVKAKKDYPKDSLLFEIETAIRHKADTHGILMRIQGMLHDTTPVDGASAVDVVKELGSVLQTLDDDQARANAAKERCEVQRSHTAREEQDLHANLALMTTVQKHTQAAMAAAKSNLDRIAAKARALQTSANTFSRAVAHAMRTLRGHSDDRATILAAVERARGVLERSADDVPLAKVGQLLRGMHAELEEQEQLERSYRSQESALNSAFLGYVRDYQELLRERRAHYQRSVSALELYGSEVAGDVAAQTGVLGTSGELEKESQDLCDSIVKFYSSFHQRRLKLIDTLKDLLPRMPELLQRAAPQS